MKLFTVTLEAKTIVWAEDAESACQIAEEDVRETFFGGAHGAEYMRAAPTDARYLPDDWTFNSLPFGHDDDFVTVGMLLGKR